MELLKKFCFRTRTSKALSCGKVCYGVFPRQSVSPITNSFINFRSIIRPFTQNFYFSDMGVVFLIFDLDDEEWSMIELWTEKSDFGEPCKHHASPWPGTTKCLQKNACWCYGRGTLSALLPFMHKGWVTRSSDFSLTLTETGRCTISPFTGNWRSINTQVVSLRYNIIPSTRDIDVIWRMGMQLWMMLVNQMISDTH